jgi:DNA-binding MarR family transcriptional regulator
MTKLPQAYIDAKADHVRVIDFLSKQKSIMTGLEFVSPEDITEGTHIPVQAVKKALNKLGKGGYVDKMKSIRTRRMVYKLRSEQDFTRFWQDYYEQRYK